MRFILSLIITLFIYQASLFSFDRNGLDYYTLRLYQTNDSVQQPLVNLSYQKLLEKYEEKRHTDSTATHQIANYYLNKAKKDQDTIELANAHYMLLRLNWDNATVAYKHCDTIINLTKNSNHKYYPARAYIGKGIISKELEKHNDALGYYITALQYAEANQNMDHIIACKHNIARLKSVLGKHQEALETFSTNLKVIRTRDTINQFLDHYIATYYNIGYSYNRLGILDSAQFYLKKGIFKSLTHDTKKYYPQHIICLRHKHLSKSRLPQSY